MLLLVALSVVATVFAVTSGTNAYFADRRAAPGDTWTAAPRTTAINQAMRLHLSALRDRERALSRALTIIAGTSWLVASAFGAASALSPDKNLGTFAMFVVIGTLVAAFGIVFYFYDRRYRFRRYEVARSRADELQRLISKALDPKAPAWNAVEQLAEWAANPDLLVYAQYSQPGMMAITYQGRLILDTKGVGGYSFYAPDWHLGPLDSVSVVRGIALNLQHWQEFDWDRGNGTFGARCRFVRYGKFPGQAPGGPVILTQGMKEQLMLMIDDPFETLPFI